MLWVWVAQPCLPEYTPVFIRCFLLWTAHSMNAIFNLFTVLLDLAFINLSVIRSINLLSNKCELAYFRGHLFYLPRVKREICACFIGILTPIKADILKMTNRQNEELILEDISWNKVSISWVNFSHDKATGHLTPPFHRNSANVCLFLVFSPQTQFGKLSHHHGYPAKAVLWRNK